MILPEDALEKLVSHNKPIVSGVCLVVKVKGDKIERMPALFHYVDDNRVKPFTMQDVKGDKLVEVGIAGLACCLIQRKVMEKVKIRNIGTSTTGGEDAALFFDARKLGFIGYADTSVKCFHMPYPEGDPRNEYHKFETPKEPEGISFSFNVSYE